ncbi:hypothetical protein CMU66_09195 [Elizabethkingia anophelis]|nr:hypothetical protein [Elizabethkingia anophelis]MDV3564943.1 hypothetical protein [Elizabethkingia anophelis]MDV3626287.1 hypothetical protein [Elizabethkingia anophelis]MDV3644048.1 hypothetical protein [Elizabethkingia anophelis]MDV3656994.1 hypothetical protein [Elizabethkingia anophelis]
MKIKLTRLSIALMLILSSCHQEIKSEKGGIDIISNVYFDASKGLDQMQSFHISKISYSEDDLIEIVPDRSFPEIDKQIYYINDSLCYSLGSERKNAIFSELVLKQKPLLVWQKKEGAVFSKEWIPNYRNRRKLSDTILFGKQYKHFEINSPWNYTRFYIYPTDTILPYSLYRHAEQDYHGRLERIDSYNKKDDIFVTLQLIPRKSWDEAARELFEFNRFVTRTKNE